MENQLVAVVETNEIGEEKSGVLVGNFQNFYSEASKLSASAKEIVVTDINQVGQMEKARSLRLYLKKIRTSTENTRKKLKEGIVREGKAIDGLANIIKAIVVPAEEHLEKQEKYAENLKKEQDARVLAERTQKLSKYVSEEDIPLYNLDGMNDEVFDKLLEGSKSSFEAKQKAENDARIAREKRIEDERLENEATIKENARLKKEIEEKEAKDVADKKIRDEAEQKRKDAETAEKKIQDDKLKKEREEKEAAKAELQAKKDADEKAKKDAEAKAENERQDSLRPEKEKLFNYAEELKNIRSPEGLSKAGQQIVESAEKGLLAVSQDVKDQIKNL